LKSIGLSRFRRPATNGFNETLKYRDEPENIDKNEAKV